MKTQADVQHTLRYTFRSLYHKSFREALSCSASLFIFIINERVSPVYKRGELKIRDGWESLAGALLDGVLVGTNNVPPSLEILRCNLGLLRRERYKFVCGLSSEYVPYNMRRRYHETCNRSSVLQTHL